MAFFSAMPGAMMQPGASSIFGGMGGGPTGTAFPSSQGMPFGAPGMLGPLGMPGMQGNGQSQPMGGGGQSPGPPGGGMYTSPGLQLPPGLMQFLQMMQAPQNGVLQGGMPPPIPQALLQGMSPQGGQSAGVPSGMYTSPGMPTGGLAQLQQLINNRPSGIVPPWMQGGGAQQPQGQPGVPTGMYTSPGMQPAGLAQLQQLINNRPAGIVPPWLQGGGRQP